MTVCDEVWLTQNYPSATYYVELLVNDVVVRSFARTYSRSTHDTAVTTGVAKLVLNRDDKIHIRVRPVYYTGESHNRTLRVMNGSAITVEQLR